MANLKEIFASMIPGGIGILPRTAEEKRQAQKAAGQTLLAGGLLGTVGPGAVGAQVYALEQQLVSMGMGHVVEAGRRQARQARAPRPTPSPAAPKQKSGRAV